jgi:hypothetical protein
MNAECKMQNAEREFFAFCILHFPSHAGGNRRFNCRKAGLSGSDDNASSMT